MVDLLIVGAGPVGLMAANLAAQAGLKTLVLEKRTTPRFTPRAIGVTPPSLSLFQDLGLSDALVDAGVTIRRACVWGNRSHLGCLDLSVLPPPFPFILSVSQVVTEGVLRNALAEGQNKDAVGRARLLYGSEVARIDIEEASVVVSTADGRSYTAAAVLGCDGPSGISRTVGDAPAPRSLGKRFAMMDLPEPGAAADDDARLYFTRRGSVESFPFGAGDPEPVPRRRRWIAELTEPAARPPMGDWIPRAVATAVEERVGVTLDPAQALWYSDFAPKETIVRRYAVGRLLLAGDAAHEFSPIGGQGMNTGFADAARAAAIATALVRGELSPPDAAARYQNYRRRAAVAAARRARISMWIGTRRSPVSAPLRDGVVRLLLKGPARRALAPHFAMLTLPGPR